MATTPKQMAVVLFGVTNCGGGLVIIGGKGHKIPPRGPAFKKIEAALKVVLNEVAAKR